MLPLSMTRLRILFCRLLCCRGDARQQFTELFEPVRPEEATGNANDTLLHPRLVAEATVERNAVRHDGAPDRQHKLVVFERDGLEAQTGGLHLQANHCQQVLDRQRWRAETIA